LQQFTKLIRSKSEPQAEGSWQLFEQGIDLCDVRSVPTPIKDCGDFESGGGVVAPVLATVVAKDSG
jgi:hypothetical protein